MEFPDGNAVRTLPVDDSAIPHAPASCGKVCDRTPAGCVKATLFFAASGALGATAGGLVASVQAVATTVAIASAASKFGLVRFQSIGFLWKKVMWVAARGVYESEHKRKRRDFLPRDARAVLAVSTPLSELHLSRTDAPGGVRRIPVLRHVERVVNDRDRIAPAVHRRTFRRR